MNLIVCLTSYVKPSLLSHVLPLSHLPLSHQMTLPLFQETKIWEPPTFRPQADLCLHPPFSPNCFLNMASQERPFLPPEFKNLLHSHLLPQFSPLLFSSSFFTSSFLLMFKVKHGRRFSLSTNS